MNDYQMTKISHGHIHELREEAHRGRMAAQVRRPTLARRVIDRIVTALSDADERQTAHWASSIHRRDAWQGRPNDR